MTPTMQESIKAFKSAFAQGLAKRPEDVRNIDELDQMIHQARAEVGQAAMGLSVQAAVKQAQASPPRCCGKPMSRHHRPKLRVHSMQGEHEAHGVSYRCGRCGRTRRPAHERLGVSGYIKTSVLFDELSSDFFLDRGAPTAVGRLKRHHGVQPGRTTVLNHAEQRGQQARRWLDQKLREASSTAEQRRGTRAAVDTVFVQMDSSSGKTVQPLVRPTLADDADVPRTPVRKLPKMQRPIEGRQVKLMCAQPQGAVDWVYDAYIGDFDQAPPRLEGLAATCGWQPGVQTVMTADGEQKNREAGEGAFVPDFQFILDHPHALGHLKDVVTFGKDLLKTPPSQWMDQSIRRLHQGEVSDLAAEVRGMATQIDDPVAQAKVDNVATYFNCRSDAVDYDKFKRRGWPLASGAVEGGHIHLVHPISKRGSGWLVPHLNNTLALACIRHSGWWDDFWSSVASSGLPQAQRSGAVGGPS